MGETSSGSATKINAAVVVESNRGLPLTLLSFIQLIYSDEMKERCDRFFWMLDNKTALFRQTI